MGDKIGHYRFDPYGGLRNPFPTVGSTPGDAPEDLTYIRQSELDRLRDRLAEIERQVIYRTEDMPRWAREWHKPRSSDEVCEFRGWAHSIGHCRPGDANPLAYAYCEAPDLRPDKPGPLFLPVIDAPDVDGEDG